LRNPRDRQFTAKSASTSNTVSAERHPARKPPVSEIRDTLAERFLVTVSQRQPSWRA
jgi:hypothetical protein